jgi:FAD/FMN-containing dehydrogenase/Fe-S oxidoreductase
MHSNSEQIRDYAERLRPDFSGEIRTDRFTRVLYSTDASIYQIEPLAVLIPRNHDDVAAALSLACRYRLPLLPRGAGTSLAGQTVGSAVVLDFSKYMNRIIEIRPEERLARVEPGVVLDGLNGVLKQSGLMFAPDVSTGNRATLGGMTGNNSCGARSIIYGLTVDHVKALRALLADGTELRLCEWSPEQWESRCSRDGREAEICRAVDRLVRNHRTEIAQRYPRIMRRVGGYNLDRFLGPGNRNLCHLVVGSEGTLATCTEIAVGLVPLPGARAAAIVHFADLVSAMEAVERVLEFEPAAVETVDRTILQLTRRQPAYARRMTFVEGDPAAILIVEFFGDNPQDVRHKLERMEKAMRASGAAGAVVRAESPEAQADVWAVRKAGLGMLSSTRGAAKPTAFVEDTAVPVAKLGRYVARFLRVLEQHGMQAAVYGHASVGCLHIRPWMNLKDPEQVRRMTEIAAAIKDLVVEHEGAMSGEHGDGIARSHWNRELFGERLYAAFKEIKTVFDPLGLMNPGKIVDALPMTSHLRAASSGGAAPPATYLDFSREGGLLGAAEQCSGLGACRKVGSGTMCPSYMVTRDEEHSTRGRANALRAALSGQLPGEGWADRRLYEALDLCLECKACKTECEANVDMAKLKYEFLAHYNKRHGASLRARIFADIARVSRAASVCAPLSNRVLRSAVFRHTIQRLLGIDPRRRLPLFARRTFRQWLRAHPPAPARRPELRVVLFTDTFADYNEPATAQATLRLLESTGARVDVPEVVCCGRPMISKGFLTRARKNALRNIARLAPYVEAGAWIVGCEPGCLLTLRDDYPDLVGTDEARRLAARVLTLEEYLVRRIDEGLWRPDFAGAERTILLHGHCHQKSLVGMSPTVRLLRMVPGFRVIDLDSGCCGMAGSFGYEREHFELSMRIGELTLFPAIRSAPPDAEIVAPGISCRQQILHGTGRRARHPAEVLAGVLLP